MLFYGVYHHHFVDDNGDWQSEECSITVEADSIEEAMMLDMPNWSVHREPADFFKSLADAERFMTVKEGMS